VDHPNNVLLSWAVTASGGQVLRSVTELAQSGERGPWLLEVEAPGWRRRLVLHAGEMGSEEQRRLFALRRDRPVGGDTLWIDRSRGGGDR
jgi:hypothetical protein